MFSSNMIYHPKSVCYDVKCHIAFTKVIKSKLREMRMVFIAIHSKGGSTLVSDTNNDRL